MPNFTKYKDSKVPISAKYCLSLPQKINNAIENKVNQKNDF